MSIHYAGCGQPKYGRWRSTLWPFTSLVGPIPVAATPRHEPGDTSCGAPIPTIGRTDHVEWRSTGGAEIHTSGQAVGVGRRGQYDPLVPGHLATWHLGIPAQLPLGASAVVVEFGDASRSCGELNALGE